MGVPLDPFRQALCICRASLTLSVPISTRLIMVGEQMGSFISESALLHQSRDNFTRRFALNHIVFRLYFL